jgi:hypothetical protein
MRGWRDGRLCARRPRRARAEEAGAVLRGVSAGGAGDGNAREGKGIVGAHRRPLMSRYVINAESLGGL